MACRTVRAKAELLRIVRTPDGGLRRDVGGKLAGRGAYVCRTGRCLITALDKGALARALATPLTADLRAALLGVTTIDDEGGARGKE